MIAVLRKHSGRKALYRDKLEKKNVAQRGLCHKSKKRGGLYAQDRAQGFDHSLFGEGAHIHLWLVVGGDK